MKKNKIIVDVTKKQNAVLLGNGICRSIGMNSCDGIIEDIRKEKNPSADANVMKKLLFPQQIVVATNDHVDENLKRLTRNMINVPYCEEDKTFLRQLLSVMPNVILTANYSTELETAAFGKFSTFTYNNSVAKASDLRRTAENLGLNSFIPLEINGQHKILWHIHGTAMKPKSVVMGHYYYGKLLREIEEYVPHLIRRYQVAKKSDDKSLQIKSWVDYFFMSDLHIIGFSMDPAEMDLWWMLCCKKRNFPDTEVFFYEPNNMSINRSEKELLLKAYGVNIVAEEAFNGNYKKYYYESIRGIR